jgi:hypothetical protein
MDHTAAVVRTHQGQGVAEPDIEPENRPGLPNRMRRYQVRMALRYRMRGEVQWLRGGTVNISGSGILFEAETALVIGAAIEIDLVLLMSRYTSVACAVCQARVTRVTEPVIGGELPLIAASITRYRLVRR